MLSPPPNNSAAAVFVRSVSSDTYIGVGGRSITKLNLLRETAMQKRSSMTTIRDPHVAVIHRMPLTETLLPMNAQKNENLTTATI